MTVLQRKVFGGPRETFRQRTMGMRLKQSNFLAFRIHSGITGMEEGEKGGGAQRAEIAGAEVTECPRQR